MIPLRWLGCVPYDRGLAIQEELVSDLLHHGSTDENSERRGAILGCEHPLVITLGRRGIEDRDLMCSEVQLKDWGVEVHRTERGGQATVHNPGQLVIYPILDLKRRSWGVRDYVEGLIEVTRLCLESFGIATHVRLNHTGLYTERGKIAFFGVRVVRGVTHHGLSINVKNRLSDFSLIRSCGVESETFDSVESYRRSLDPLSVLEHWYERFPF